MLLQFPRKLLREKTNSWNLRGVSVSGGQTTLGQSTYIRSDGGGFWACNMSDVGLSGSTRQEIRELTLLWRAVRQLCDGGVSQIVVPCNDALFRPWPEGLSHTVGLNVPHGDGTGFDDGSFYYQSVIDIVAAAAPQRATSIDITINYAGDLIGGERFSILHLTYGPRLYEIRTVTMTSDTEATITFRPPLREAISDATPLEFDRPVCLMRLATPNAMDLAIEPWTVNSASVDFVEDLRTALD